MTQSKDTSIKSKDLDKDRDKDKDKDKDKTTGIGASAGMGSTGFSGTSSMSGSAGLGGTSGIGSAGIGSAGIAGSGSSPSTSPKQIEGEIGQTREAISDDIRALGEKLSPAALKAEAKETLVEVKDAAVDKAREVKDAAVDKAREVKDAAMDKVKDVGQAAAHTLSEAAHEVSEKVDEVGMAARRAGDVTWHFVRENAVPLTLLGVGAGLLVANNLPSRRERPDRATDTYAPYATRRVELDEYDVPYEVDTELGLESDYRPMESDVRPARSRNAGMRSKARRASARAQGAIQHAGERAQHAVHDAADRVQHGASQTRDRMVHTFQSARQTSREIVADHPLAVGAALVALGIGVGALLPATQRENQLLGETRDRLLDEARSAVQGVGEVAKETAKAVL